MKQSFSQYNETDRLKQVIIGRYEGYRQYEDYVEIVNEEQKKGLPQVEQLETEFNNFQKTMEEYGVQVIVPEYVGKFVYDQLTPRDIGFVVGDKFVLCHMKKASRRYEAAGIFKILNEVSGAGMDILIPENYNTLLEGGDVMVDKGNLFIGLSQRSNELGYRFLKHHFGKQFNVIPLQCSSLDEGENVLHLDCTFNPVGENLALIYPPGFEHIPDEISKNYEWIEVRDYEQALLATNVLSLDRNTVISRNHPQCKRVNDEMRNRGLRVIEIDFDGAPATGGSFRCCTLPLHRQPSG